MKKSIKPYRIGLALGSGVARGWSHIGVVKTLVKAGFAPDIIVGTSIGAVVGGAYAANYLQELETFARELTARKMFGLLDLSFSGSSLFSGRKLSAELYKHMSDIKIEDMHKTFIAVATELATGHEIWLRKGSLVDSLRASYALPGVFAPVHINGRWLIDGALVNPVPVSVCRGYGARLVIAVNLNRDAFGKTSTSKIMLSEEAFAPLAEKNPNKNPNKNNGVTESNEKVSGVKAYRTMMKQIFSSSPRSPGMTTILLAALNIVQDRLARSRLAGDPPDIHIAPRVGHIGLLEFNKMDEAIKLGVEATEQVLPEIETAAKVLF